MCIYVYMYMHIYTYIHVYVYVYIYIYISFNLCCQSVPQTVGRRRGGCEEGAFPQNWLHSVMLVYR